MNGYDVTKMRGDYIAAKNAIWDAWIAVRTAEIQTCHGIELEMKITTLADDIKKRREMKQDEMVDKCIDDIANLQSK